MKIVRLVNNGDTPFVSKYDGERFTIQPHSETLVPYGAMVLWCGDPTTRNLDERRRFRVKENARLHVKYGAYDDETKYALNAPKLDAFTLDGERIPTVLIDPDGLLADIDLSDTTEENAVRRELQDLRGQMSRIEEMLASGQLQLVSPGEGFAGGDNADDLVQVAKLDPATEVDTPAIPVDVEGVEIEVPAMTVPDPTVPDPPTSTTPPVDEPTRVRVGSRSRPQ